MTKRKRLLIVFFTVSGLITAALTFHFRRPIIRRLTIIWNSKNETSCPGCWSLFPDNVRTQDQAYKYEGIKEQKQLKDLDKLEKKGLLVHVEDNDYYYIDDLKHSRPYLLPKAVRFLENLGKRYADKCKNRNISYKQFRITSLTRSIESVDDLKRKNPVAIKESAHLKGKTIDISYTAFGKDSMQLDLFLSALSELRKEGKCYAKYEQTTGCLHITAR